MPLLKSQRAHATYTQLEPVFEHCNYMYIKNVG